MRRPSASGAWALGLMIIAVGVIGTAYAATRLALDLPEVSPRWIRMVVALSIVPAAAGILLMRKEGLSGARALGLSAIALGTIGVIYSIPLLSYLLTSEVELSGTIVASALLAMALSIAPLVVGTLLMRRKGMFVVRSLGVIVITLGAIGSTYRAVALSVYFATFDELHTAIVVDVSMLAVVILGSVAVGLLLLRKKDLAVVPALGLIAVALGVIGATYSMSVLISTLLLVPGAFYWYSIVLSILLFAPLLLALSVVPVSAGVILMRRTHASGAWALGLMAIVFGVVGTTFSAAQLLASSAPTLYISFVGLTLLNTAWLP